MTERTYPVRGMTCDHCVNAVGLEVGGVSGVREVHVDLAAGSVTVRGEGFDDQAVRAAVIEAGYEVPGG